MYQFFVEPNQILEAEKKVIIEGSDVNHIRNVLRMRLGEEIAVRCNGEGSEYRCAVAAYTDTSVICDLLFIREENNELPARILLFQGLPKSDKMELVIQKAVELGAAEIIPVACKRCVMKLDPKKEKNKIARWQGIADAAAKQSKRGLLPQIKDSMTFKEAIAYAESSDIKLIPYELSEDGMNQTRELLGKITPGMTIAVFIGPEGGFDTAEIELATEKGFAPITLGKRILRTETAGLMVLAWLGYLLEP